MARAGKESEKEGGRGREGKREGERGGDTRRDVLGDSYTSRTGGPAADRTAHCRLRLALARRSRCRCAPDAWRGPQGYPHC